MGIRKRSSRRTTGVRKKQRGGKLRKVTRTVAEDVPFLGTGLRAISAFRGRGSLGKKRRSVNPLNVKALRKATSRLASFSKISGRIEKGLSKLARKKGFRSSSSRGTITREEARRALER